MAPIDPSAHLPKDIPEKAATCTEPGYCDGMECALCGFITTDNVVIPPLGHTEENIPGIDATCTETGLTTGKYCTVCEETTLEQTTIPALGHIEAERDGILPTCTATGLTPIIYCSRCEDVLVSQQNELPIIPHVDKTVPGRPATCTEVGLTDGIVCRGCGLLKRSQVSIPALGHDFKTGSTCAHCDLTLSVGLTYVEDENGEYYILVNAGTFDGAKLVIPAEYEGKPVRKIAEGAFAGNTTIREVVILDDVEVIGEGAFNGCSALEEVTAPASITVVEQNAFNDCSLLATIRSASFEQMDRWTDDFSGNSNFQVISTIKDTRSPYHVAAVARQGD